MQDLESEVKKLSDIITGNGSPESGLILKLDRVVQSHDSLNKDINKIKNRLWGVVIALIINATVFVAAQLYNNNQELLKLNSAKPQAQAALIQK